MNDEDPIAVQSDLKRCKDSEFGQGSVDQPRDPTGIDDVISSRARDWWSFWLVTWLGTSLAGGAFGGGIGSLMFVWSVSLETLPTPFFGLVTGVIWAGSVGLFVISTFAFIVWCFGLQRHPGILAVCAGALTGFVCAPIAFVITSPLGAAGAYLATQRFCRLMREDPICQSHRLVFSIQDLFWRMTGFAVILTMWLTVIRWFSPLF